MADKTDDSSTVQTSPADKAVIAAADRTVEIPAGPTLIDEIGSSLWHAGEDGPVEAGSKSRK